VIIYQLPKYLIPLTSRKTKGNGMADFTVSPSTTLSDRMLTLPAILAAPLSRMVDWQSAWVQRQRVRSLDTHLRRDIGLTDASPARASVLPGWDLPLAGLR
jgi:hypothetical protein